MTNWTGLSISKFLAAILVGLILSWIIVALAAMGSNYEKKNVDVIPTQTVSLSEFNDFDYPFAILNIIPLLTVVIAIGMILSVLGRIIDFDDRD